MIIFAELYFQRKDYPMQITRPDFYKEFYHTDIDTALITK